MSRSHESGTTFSSDELDQVMAATRLVGALIAESMAHLRPAITAAQWRV